MAAEKKVLEPLPAAPAEPDKKSIGMGLAVIFILGLLAVLAFLLYQNWQLKKQVSRLEQKLTPSPSPEAAQLQAQGIFQKILAEKCQEIEKENYSFLGIKLKDLPVTLDLKTLKLALREENMLVCTGNWENKAGYVVLELQDDNELNLYDESSQELGHGGPAFLGSEGVKIKEENSLKIFIYPLFSHAGPTLVGDLPIMVRGLREIRLTSDETIFVNTSQKIIKENDSRLTKFLLPYSQESDLRPGEREIIVEGLEEKIVEEFFSNLDQLTSSEKAILEKVEKELKAITLKSKSSFPLTEDEALLMAESELGDCDCQERKITISQKDGDWEATVIDEGLLDDSIKTKQTILLFNYVDGAWEAVEKEVSYRCAPGRGHQEFSSELCE